MVVEKLNYLVDISEKLNDVNLSLQSQGTNILTLSNKTEGTEHKLMFWKVDQDRNKFPCLSEFIKDHNVDFCIFKNSVYDQIMKP